ncbi:hypothetical protein X759_17725 [Mesorhizobium sp. LSHC420B00]|nr:hypothetical protein X759_17725 [Mesorhizobium sp. LSHC420B00]
MMLRLLVEHDLVQKPIVTFAIMLRAPQRSAPFAL